MSKIKPVMKPFVLRLPQELYRTVELIAEAEIRPVNSQILVLLREGIEQWQSQNAAVLEEPLQERS